MPKFIDITGQKFGRLTVIERTESNEHGAACWKCICRCRNYAIVPGGSLRSGNTKSCGCKLAEYQSVSQGKFYSSFIKRDYVPCLEDLDDLVKW